MLYEVITVAEEELLDKAIEIANKIRANFV